MRAFYIWLIITVDKAYISSWGFWVDQTWAGLGPVKSWCIIWYWSGATYGFIGLYINWVWWEGSVWYCSCIGFWYWNGVVCSICAWFGVKWTCVAGTSIGFRACVWWFVWFWYRGRCVFIILCIFFISSLISLISAKKLSLLAAGRELSWFFCDKEFSNQSGIFLNLCVCFFAGIL